MAKKKIENTVKVNEEVKKVEEVKKDWSKIEFGSTKIVEKDDTIRRTIETNKALQVLYEYFEKRLGLNEGKKGELNKYFKEFSVKLVNNFDPFVFILLREIIILTDEILEELRKINGNKLI